MSDSWDLTKWIKLLIYAVFKESVSTLESPAEHYMSRYNDSYKYIYGINPTKSDHIICPQKLEPLDISGGMMWIYFMHKRKNITMSSWKTKRRTILDQNTLNTAVVKEYLE